MNKNVNVIAELSRKNDMLRLVEELHMISPISRVIISPMVEPTDDKLFQAVVESQDASVTLHFKDIGVARTIAKVIRADTGADVIMRF